MAKGRSCAVVRRVGRVWADAEVSCDHAARIGLSSRGLIRQTNQLSEPGTPRTPAGVVELRVHGVAGAPLSQNLADSHPIRINGDSEAGVYRRRKR